MFGMEIKDLVTLIGSVTAGLAGIYTVWKNHKSEKDKIKIKRDSMHPRIEDATYMHVINLSNHKIVLEDWGFILPDYKIDSIPYDCECAGSSYEEYFIYGKRELLEKYSYMDFGYRHQNLNIIGGYAKTVNQSRYSVVFDRKATFGQKVKIHTLRLFKRLKY